MDTVSLDQMNDASEKQFNQESFLTLHQDIIVLGEEISKNIDDRLEPIEKLQQLNSSLFIYSNHIFKNSKVQWDPILKKELQEKVFKKVVEKMLNEKVIQNQQYLPQILKFFRNVLVNFYPFDVDNENLAEVVHLIFNLDANLYSQALTTYNQRRNQVGDDEPSLEQRRIESERQWRSQLKIGDRLDAIKIKQTAQMRVLGWARGTIIKEYNENTDTFLLTFDNEPPSQNQILNKTQANIAPEGMYTDDYEWRDQLKAGDLVDCQDSENIWYRSTILDKRQIPVESVIQENSIIVDEIHIAFRVYDDEEASKIDEEGRKYVGWSNKYDEWKNKNDITVQRFNTIVKHYKQAGRTLMIYDTNVDDSGDITFNNKVRKVFTVFRHNFFANLKCISDYLNEFGQRAGFDSIMNFLREISETQNQKKVTLKHLYYLMDFLSKSSQLWHRQFACEYIPKLMVEFEKAILLTNQQQTGPLQLPFVKDHLTQIQKSYSNILKRHYTIEVYSHQTSQLSFQMGFSLFNSEKLEKRIAGFKEILEQVKNARYQVRRALSSKEIIILLKEHDIFKKIFGENYHIQLIQRSKDLLSFFILEKQLGPEEMNYIWEATKKDQQTKIEIYKIIQDTSLSFKNEEIEAFIDKFITIPPEDFVEKEIECIYDMTKFSYKPYTYSQKVVNLLWNIALRKLPYKKQLVEIAIDKFIDLIRNWEKDQKNVFIYECLDNIKVHQASMSCIKILMKLLDQIPNYTVGMNPSLIQFASMLVEQNNLLQILIDDLIHYSSQVNDLWTKGVLNEENIETIELFDQPFSHRTNMNIRLNFIRQILQNTQTHIREDHLETLWELLNQNSKVSIDSDLFFSWFKNLLNDLNKITEETMKQFFQNKICNNDSNSMNNNNTTQQKLDFKIHVPPNELEGIDMLWRLLEQSDKKNLDLAANTINLITKVYLSLSTIIEDQIHIIGEQFTKQCLSRLNSVLRDESIAVDDKKSFAYNSQIMLKSFFEDSEKNGTGGIRTHYSMDRGEYLERIVIQNSISQQKNIPKYIEINTYSNMTIWELKKIVATKTKASPLKIQLFRQDPKKKAITEGDNAKMLRDLRLESFEIITASRKVQPYIYKVPLTNRNKELLPEPKKIFESWFKMFSEDGFMTPESCVNFIKGSTNDPNVNQQDQRVTKLFDDYDKDRDGKLNLPEFLEFYRDRAVNRQDLVWSNLAAHQLGNDLKPLSNNYFQEEDSYELKDMTQLSRYKLASDQEQFYQLFELMEQLKVTGHDDIWSIICNLSTNPQLYSDILFLKNIESLNDKDMPVQLLFYKLQMIESLVQEFQIKRKNEIKCYYNESQDYASNYPSIDQASSAPQSGVPQVSNPNIAIPLPQASTGGYIPDPPSRVPFIGPVPPQNINTNHNTNNSNNNNNNNNNYNNNNNNNNNMNNNVNGKEKVNEMLDQFVGSIIQENISNDLQNLQLANYIPVEFRNENLIDDMKQEWVYNFLKIGGFKILFNLLQNFIQSFKYKQREDILNSRVQKDCLNIILKLLKNILISAFCSISPNNEISQELKRKMSSVNEEEKVEDPIEDSLFENKERPKNNHQTQQEETQKEFEPLIQLLQQQNIGQQIIQNVDFQQFQDQIFTIFSLILSKEKQVILYDKYIIDQGISLWLSCLASNPDLFDFIVNDVANDLEKGDLKQKPNSRILIEDGLLCETYSIRNSFKEALLFICKSVKPSNLKEQPSDYFLKQLINSLDLVNYKSRDSKQYFMFLKELFTIYFEKGNRELFNTHTLIVHLIQRMNQHSSFEKKTDFYEDTTLTGYINLINLILTNNKNVLTSDELSNLLQYIVQKLLFTYDIPPSQTHITPNIDLADIEKETLNKCQTIESRNSAYQLLVTVCNQKPEFLGDILIKHWHPLIFKVKKPKRGGYQPKTDGRSRTGFCGLKNLGCICYMNSMMQQFYNIPTFRYCSLAANDKVAQNLVKFEGDDVDDNLLHQFITLFSHLELSERQEYNPREFCFSFKDFEGRPTNVRIQQDAQEFLNVFFDRLENGLKGTTQQYLLENIFGGKTNSLMLCKNCGNMKTREEDFYNLSLEVKNQKNLYDSLNKFIAKDIINDYECEHCKQRVDVERRTVLQKLPNLNSKVEFPNVLNLKDFMFNQVMKSEKQQMQKQKSERSQKIQDQFQDKISQNSEVYESVEKMEDEKSQAEGSNNQKNLNEEIYSNDEEEDEDQQMKIDSSNDDNSNFEYKLVGVVLHMGTADAGHYLSYININREAGNEEDHDWLKTEKDKWLEFNDSNVKDYKFQDLEDDCFGGGSSSMMTGDSKSDYSRNAYMLIYEKRRKEKIKIIITQDIVDIFGDQKKNKGSQTQQALDCDSTAISRGLQVIEKTGIAIPHIFFIYPELAKGLIIHYDSEKKEYYTLVDFNSIQKFVPNNYYKSVHEDNTLFLFERQIFHNSFFVCTKQLIQLTIQEVPELLQLPDESQQMFEFMERLLLDILAMSSENKQLGELTQLLINMLEKNESYTLKFIEERILVQKQINNQSPDKQSINTSPDKGSNKDQQKGFFELLISNMDVDVRSMAQAFITFSVNKLIELNEIDMLDHIMNIALGMIPDELIKNWLKINQFLTFIFDVVRTGQKQLEYLVSKGIVFKLIDFFLENDSPEAISKGGLKRQLMGSNYANPPMDNLILTVSWIARHQSMIPIFNDNQQLSSEEYKEKALILMQQYEPSHMKLYFNNLSTILSQDDVKMLSQKQFFMKAIKYQYQSIELGRLAHHVSYNNYEFSQKISKKLLIALNKCNGDEVRPYLDLIEQIISIKDQFQRQRLEWILGIPYLKNEKPMNSSYSMMNQHTKLGVAVIDSMSDEIFEYRSSLFKSQSTVKESLLQILYYYRKRWTSSSLQILQSLFKVAKISDNIVVFDYMKNLSPPNYNYARYVDWILPYLEDTMQHAYRTLNLHSSKIELMIATSIKATYLELNGKSPQVQLDLPQAQINTQKKEEVIFHEITQESPEPYMILNVVSEKQIATIVKEEYNMKLYVTEFTCNICESRPTGTGNLILKQIHINKARGYGNNQDVSQDQEMKIDNEHDNYHKKQQQAYGRGRNNASQPQNRSTRRKNGKGKKKKTILSNAKIEPQNQQDTIKEVSIAQDAQFGSYSINDNTQENNSPQDAQMDVDGENIDKDEYIQNDVDEYSSSENDEIGGRDEGEIYSNQKVQPDENLFNPPQIDQINQDVEQDNIQNNQQQYELQGTVPQVQSDQLINQDQEFWTATLPVALSFTVVNNSPIKVQKVYVRIQNKEYKQDEELIELVPKQGQALNFFYPHSPIPVQLVQQRERDVLFLTKLRPFDDWGNMQFDLEILESQGNKVPGIIVQDVRDESGFVPQDDKNTDIQCLSCTFINPSYNTFCEMCGGSLKGGNMNSIM